MYTALNAVVDPPATVTEDGFTDTLTDGEALLGTPSGEEQETSIKDPTRTDTPMANANSLVLPSMDRMLSNLTPRQHAPSFEGSIVSAPLFGIGTLSSHHGNRETPKEVSAQLALDFSHRTGTTPVMTRFVAVKWLDLAKPHAVSGAELGVVGYFGGRAVLTVAESP